MNHVEKDPRGQVEAGPKMPILLWQRRMARRTETQPSDVDTDKPSERASDGDTLPEMLG